MHFRYPCNPHTLGGDLTSVFAQNCPATPTPKHKLGIFTYTQSIINYNFCKIVIYGNHQKVTSIIGVPLQSTMVSRTSDGAKPYYITAALQSGRTVGDAMHLLRSARKRVAAMEAIFTLFHWSQLHCLLHETDIGRVAVDNQFAVVIRLLTYLWRHAWSSSISGRRYHLLHGECRFRGLQ